MKADELCSAPDSDFALTDAAGAVPGISWKGEAVAVLMAGPGLLTPEIRPDRALAVLGADVQKQVLSRLIAWFDAQKLRHLTPLLKMSEAALDPQVPAVVRAVFTQLADAGGVVARVDLDSALGHLDKDQRHLLRRAGLDIGVLDIYHPGLLKPGSARWRAALIATRLGKPCLPLPTPGITLLATEDKGDQLGAKAAGFRAFGPQMLRVDMAERMARAAHEAIAKGEAFTALSPQIVSLGLHEPAFLELMRLSGFRAIDDAAEGSPNWAFRGRQKARPRPAPLSRGPRSPQSNAPQSTATAPAAAPAPAQPRPGNAFAGLADLLSRNG